MVAEDYDEIYELWRVMPGMHLGEADSREQIAAYVARNPGQSFVSEHEGRIIGTILCGNDGRNAYIHHTAVAERYRRRGVASELLRLALAKQTDFNRVKCHLLIFCDNDLGQAFWRRHGFTFRQEIGVMTALVGKTEKNV
jgi:ribosomal protein S18 acetylase RimI-like enzyme